MIKVLVYSDLQATEGSERLFSNPSIPLQRWRVDHFYKQLSTLFEIHDCNAVWDLGDTFDDRTSLPVPTVASVISGIKGLKISPTTSLKIVGNHEQYTRSTEIDSASVFEGKFKILRGVSAVEIEDVVVVAASYPSNMNRMEEEIESLMMKHRRKPIILLGHFDVAGSRMKSGIVPNGLNNVFLDAAALSLFGHIHLPQQIGKRNAYYVGSPFQQNFGESGEEKRVGLLTIDGKDITLDWLSMEGFPLYETLTYESFESSFSPETENRFRVIVRTPEEAQKIFKHQFADRLRVEYAFQKDEPTTIQSSENTVVDFESAAKKWLLRSNPAAVGLELSVEDLLDMAKDIIDR